MQILDRRDFPGDVYSMIEGATTWVRSKINVRYVITGSVKRKERPELPMDTAVVNAVAHWDYRSRANVQVYLDDDRLDVVNPGRLPAGMAEAESGVKSVLRNPLLFVMLHRMNAVEHVGSGNQRIHDLCPEWKVPAPKTDVSKHWITVTFRRPVLVGGNSGAMSEGPGRHQVKILRKSLAAQHITELMAVAGRKDRTKLRNQVLRLLQEVG